ncbi:MAG: Asp-tRNA(Asn)/Glu-tRNA(Gln) amidotransferase subunit GatB [Armatimonadetes bacterium]|nr:Asp-tRNA(Asn)/Glu-tRNA(Gln) amidotransferase subunit GatB [Armatimonadota bacterium]
MTAYEPVIGMEVHAELLTESKMFCNCSAEFGGEPNSRTCPVCLGLPGALPVANRKAVEYVVRTALALNCEISRHSIFHRKNYFYPDLPKNYQISQYGDTPIGVRGWLDVTVNGETRRIRIRRVHLEEDTGKLIHAPDSDESLVDFNRSTVPLMEIVSEADIRSAEEAREYLVKLRSILTFLGVNDGKMEEGSLRCEPNISIRPVGVEEFGTRTEMKNLNSFRAVYRGTDYEISRQEQVLREGGEIVHETLRWDDVNGVTATMRSKEFEQEYRYFPEPDLVPMEFTDDYVQEQRRMLPELPETMKRRFVEQYGIPEYDAAELTSTRALAKYFEAAVKAFQEPKAVSNWMMGDYTKALNSSGIEISESKVKPEDLGALLKMVSDGTISGKIAKSVFDEMFESGASPAKIVEKSGMTQISGDDEIVPVVDRVLSENPDVVRKITGGDAKAMGFLVGQVMKYTQGRANPGAVNKILRERLAESMKG